MHVTELIERLNEVLEEHGDLLVTQYQWNDQLKPHRSASLEVVKVKANYKDETFVEVEHLETGGYGGGPMFTDGHQKVMRARPAFLVAHLVYHH